MDDLVNQRELRLFYDKINVFTLNANVWDHQMLDISLIISIILLIKHKYIVYTCKKVP